MAKNTKDSESIVSGAGLFLGIMTTLVEEIKSAGGTSEDIHNLGRPEGRETLRQMAELVPRPFHNKMQRKLNLEPEVIRVPADDEWFDLEVDYDLGSFPASSMRKEFVQRDWVYLGPAVSGKKVLRVKLINPDGFFYLKDARKIAAALGYRLLEGPACESFKAKYPDYDEGGRSIIFGGNEWLHQGSRKILILKGPDTPLRKQFRTWWEEFYCLHDDAVSYRRNLRWAVAAL